MDYLVIIAKYKPIKLFFMKNSFLALIFFAISFSSFSLNVTQTVRHVTDVIPVGTSTGCAEVRLKVVYNTGGSINGIAFSTTATINQGSSYNFSVTIPNGATIVSKTVEFQFAGGSSHNYLITNSTTADLYFTNLNCYCPPAHSRAFVLKELAGRTEELQFHFDTTGSGGC